MRELAQGGSRRILLNMADVTRIDSSGLGQPVAAYTTLTRAGGEMELVNLAKPVYDLLQVFELFEDEASAMSSFLVAERAAVQAQT